MSMPSPPAGRKSFISRGLLFKLLLPFLGVLLGLAVAEVMLRQLRPDLGWRLQRDAYLGWASEEYLSFDPSSEAKPGVPRLLFLGDSFLAGGGVTDLQKRFSNLIADRLSDAEVRTLASGGWGTDQELLAYLEKGRPWRPDFVFLCFCANNDISNNLSNSHGISTMMKPYFTLGDSLTLQLHGPTGRPIALADHEAKVRHARFHSELLDLLRLKLGRIREAPPPVNPGADSRYQMFMRQREDSQELYELQPALSWSPQEGVNHVSAYIHEAFPLNTYQWTLLEKILQRLRNETAAQGAELVVVLLPVSYRPQDPRFLVGGKLVHTFRTPAGPFTFKASEPTMRLGAICRQLDVSLFDPSDTFRRIVVTGDLARHYWPDPEDRHFSEMGHRVVADLLIAYLKEHYPDLFSSG